MAIYTVNLMQGDTILGTSIKADTIEEYLNAAAVLYTKRGLDNPFQPKLEELDKISQSYFVLGEENTSRCQIKRNALLTLCLHT